MNRRTAASLLRPMALFAAILMATFAGIAPAALANDTGNNGTVKIHDGATENDPGEVRNEPHVCTFHLHFYFADTMQSGTWEIQEWAPTGEKGTVVLSGTYNTAGDGEDRQPAAGVYELPDGHYKLFWDGDTVKHDKMKVFWVDCDVEMPVPVDSGAPSESASASASASTSASASASASASQPGGGELPIDTESPSGGVAGATGTPFDGGVAGIDATPPPTDTATPLAAASNDGWRAILIGLAVLIAAAVFMIPTRTAARVENRSSRRGR